MQMKKLIPVILALVGLGIGLGAGIFLRPAAEVGAMAEGHDTAAETLHVDAEVDPESLPDYVKLNNQFVVPVLQDGRVTSMVILALSLEVKKGATEHVYSREPKVRDALLQVMFDHANAGGFDGDFTDGANLVFLRAALLEAAKSTVGEDVTDVLISDIARQDQG